MAERFNYARDNTALRKENDELRHQRVIAQHKVDILRSALEHVSSRFNEAAAWEDWHAACNEMTTVARQGLRDAAALSRAEAERRPSQPTADDSSAAIEPAGGGRATARPENGEASPRALQGDCDEA